MGTAVSSDSPACRIVYFAEASKVKAFKFLPAQVQAVRAARKVLKATGFVALGVKTQKGEATYANAIGSRRKKKKTSLPKTLRKV